jgi:site-specific recombinase XerD
MQEALERIAALLTEGHTSALHLPWGQVRFAHVVAIRAQLSAKYSTSTTNKMLSALRGVLKAAWNLGLLTAEEYQKAAGVRSVLGETLPAGRSLSMGEIAALMQACQSDPSPKGVRDAAIVGLLYGAGLRRAELVGLTLEDYDATAGTLKVLGKRNRQRLVPVVGGAKAALEDWIQVRGRASGALLLPSRKGGRFWYSPMTSQTVYNILKQRGTQAGLSSFSPHDFRRTFVGDLLEGGADIVTVQKMAGHANVTTTARYDRRGEATKRKAAEMLHVPYKKRGL